MIPRVENIPQHLVPNVVLGATPGAVLVLAGLDGGMLRRLIEGTELKPSSPRALFTRISRARTTEAAVAQLIKQLADTAQRLWPVWYTDVSFSECGSDTLGRLASVAIIRRTAAEIPRLKTIWAEAAADLALDHKQPLVRNVPTAIQVEQLALVVSRYGLVLVVDAEQSCEDSDSTAIVHALEWVAQLTQCAVVALFRMPPPHRPPFDRILYGARIVTIDEEVEGEPAEVPGPAEAVWLAPWLGSPHPLSETEQRLEKALRADDELARLFDCNQSIETVHGSRPKVDFVWAAGRMVVELDGYGSHGNRASFMYDRHRDYELMMSGYTVLRLANDEIAQDMGKAVEKIRDIVHLCRQRIS